MNLHFATCPTWVNLESDCTCQPLQQKPWRIRKESEALLFPWAVYRRSGTAYERLMSTSSHDRAVQLVQSLIWLARRGVRA